MTEEQYKKLRYDNDTDVYEESDSHGVYRTGVFLNGSTSVLVTHDDNGWYMKLHSKNPIGMVELASYRRTFLPEKATIAYIVSPIVNRENIYTLFEIHAKEESV